VLFGIISFSEVSAQQASENINQTDINNFKQGY